MQRSDFIGGSDAKRILDGDWFTLYQEKIGTRPAEDLTHNFPVQLGSYTERFHLDWLNKYEGFDIIPQMAIHQMKNHPMIRANCDGFCKNHNTIVEVKHSNGGATRQQMVDWYQPQVAHYCNVHDIGHCILSYIAGNRAPDWFKLEPSIEYRNELLGMELAFWWYVENRMPPTQIPDSSRQLKELAAAVKVDDLRSVDMTGNNAWAALAIDYQLNAGAVELFEKAKAGLKALVESDVGLARGHGVVIRRNKKGHLTLTEGSDS